MVKYQGKVHYWELIPASIDNNSQNEIGRYEAFVASASKMLKENDSKNIVLAGGCLDKKWNCIQLLKNSNFLKHVDILTLDIKQGDASASIRELRWLMNIQGGKDKPIWVTHLDPGRLGLTPPFYQTIVRCIGAGVDNVFINKRYLWSFLLSDLSLLRNGLDQVVPSQSFRFGAGGFAQTFHTADGITTALWMKEGLQTITLKVGSDPIEVFHPLSDRSDILYPVDGLISITLTPLPIYLRGEGELSVKSIVPHNLFSALRLPPKKRSEKPAYIVTIDNTSLISLIGDIIIGHLKGKPVMQSFRVPPQSIQPIRFYLPEFPLLCKDSSVRFKVQVDGRTAAMLEVKSPETIVHIE
jgi:hypothetical protein